MEHTNDNKLWILPHGIAVRDNRHLDKHSGAFSIINNDDVFKTIRLQYDRNPTEYSQYEFKWIPKREYSIYGGTYPKLQLTLHSKDEIMEEFRKAIEVLEAIEVKLKENTIYNHSK